MAQQFNYQGVEGPVMSKPQGSEPVTTLLIRHLPDGIPHDTLCRLLSHYGASDARPCSTARLKNCAFADFKTEALAFQAQRQLNGLRFLGKVLAVERANSPSKDEKSQQPGSQLRKDVLNAATVKSENEGLRSGSAIVSEPIAPKLGIDYPFPPHLEYVYPPPDGNILTNIVNALIAVPKFYTQVLHLMNKMNLPAPFRMALPTPPLPPSVPAPQPPPPPAPIPSKPVSADQSSSESEMESSDEDENSKELKTPGRKRARHEAIVGPAFDKSVAHEAVGVKLGTLVPKEIPLIKKRNPVLQIKIAPKVIQNENINNNDNEQNTEEPSKSSTDPRPFASPEELEKGKLPPEEILSLPMFKNYSAGNPAPVLYIKNLAKDVVPEDFYYIFGSLFGSFDEAKSGLHVKLMQEGRMRGQAFVTFPSVDFAHRALNLANGYVFKGKPIIIQFGRNPATAKGN